MPIETFGGIAELNPAYPPPSDGLVGGDDHIRGIKAAVKATFPNLDEPLEATSAGLDAAAALVVSGATVLADTGAKFKTNTKDGFENPSAGKVAVTAQDGSAVKQTVAEFTGADKKLKVLGPLQSVGPITGPGSVPIGASVMWFTNTLPADAGWAWANGSKVNVTDNPVLAALWSDRLTDGGTKIPLPDLREVVPVGNSTMGATTARGIIDNFTGTVLTTLLGVFGAAKHVLTTGQLPKHSHANSLNDPGHNHNVTPAGQGSYPAQPGGDGSASRATSTLTTTTNTTGITLTNAQAGNDEAHNNVQPSAVVNWIVRIG